MGETLPAPKSCVVPAILGYFAKNDFTEVEDIGYGAEAVVSKGYNRHYDVVAIKKFFKMGNVSGIKEIDILIKHSRHPNIVELFGVLIRETGGKPSTQIGYVMKFMQNGSLDKIIHNPSKLYGYEQIFSWTQQIARGIGFLHRNGIIHRDVKPKNILLGFNLDDLKVSDFGTARTLDKETLTTNVGTVLYMAPEIFTENKYSFPTDIYSFTITIWEIIYRQVPYSHLANCTHLEKLNMVSAGERPFLRDGPIPEVMQMLLRGWHVKPEQRPFIGDFLTFAITASQQMKNAEKPITTSSTNLEDAAGIPFARESSFQGPDSQNVLANDVTRVESAPSVARHRTKFTYSDTDSGTSSTSSKINEPRTCGRETTTPRTVTNLVQRPKNTDCIWILTFPKELGGLVLGRKMSHVNSYQYCLNVNLTVISPRNTDPVIFKVDGTLFEQVHAVCLDIWKRLSTNRLCLKQKLDDNLSRHFDSLNQFQQLLLMEEHQIYLKKKGSLWTIRAFYQDRLEKGLDILRQTRSFPLQSEPHEV